MDVVPALLPGPAGRSAAWLARLNGVQKVGSSNLPAPTSFVNDFVNKLLAMAYAQNDPEKITELLTIGGLQIGTPTASQKWVDEFLASRRQGLSIRTFEYYRDILYRLIGTDLTPKDINNYLSSLNVGNAKLNHYQVIKVFCNWLCRTKKITKNPIDLVDRPKTSKKLLPAITKEQLATLIKSLDNLRDVCILRLLFDSGIRLSELVGIKDIDFDWDKGTVTVIGKGDKQRKAIFTKDTGELLKQWFSEHETFELNKSGVQSKLKRLEIKTGIDCNPHAFRRGFANNQFKQGLSTRVVMSLGGWSDIKQVEKYSKQFSQEDALEQYDRG
jgi:integrase/recombinase XerD